MRKVWSALALSSVLAVGCSSQPAAEPVPEGALPAGTAHISIDGRDGGTTHQVRCASRGFSTDIRTGDETSGVSALVSGGDELSAQTVSIRDLAGFTGSYNAGLGEPDAEVSMIGPTFVVTGTATGFRTDEPSFTTDGKFTLRVAC